MDIFNQFTTPTAAKPFPEMLTAIQCIRAEGIKTALLTNNWLLEDGTTHMPLDRSMFDVVGMRTVLIFSRSLV